MDIRHVREASAALRKKCLETVEAIDAHANGEMTTLDLEKQVNSLDCDSFSTLDTIARLYGR